jgi:uncharacterized alpha-E superfamily protein
MGAVSLEQTGCLLWLGRYTERVYTTVRMYYREYDQMIDETDDSYDAYCRRMDIPNIYTSKSDFLKRYPFDLSNPDSIAANMSRAYDNAILLRGELGTNCLAYIQLSMYDINKASASSAPFIEFQALQDHILAFWGIVDDQIDSEKVRYILKTGKRIERVDLYARMHRDRRSLIREITRLSTRIGRSGLRYDPDLLADMIVMAQQPEPDYTGIISLVEQIGV